MSDRKAALPVNQFWYILCSNIQCWVVRVGFTPLQTAPFVWIMLICDWCQINLPSPGPTGPRQPAHHSLSLLSHLSCLSFAWDHSPPYSNWLVGLLADYLHKWFWHYIDTTPTAFLWFIPNHVNPNSIGSFASVFVAQPSFKLDYLR